MIELPISSVYRKIVLAIEHGEVDGGRWTERPALAVVLLDGLRFEMQYRRGDTAFAACKRIAREFKLPAKPVWRSRPQ